MAGPVLITKQIAEDLFNKEILVKATLRELIFYLIFLCFLTMVALGFSTTAIFHLNKALEQQFVQFNFEDVPTNVAEVNNIDDFWSYVNHTLKYSFFWIKEEEKEDNEEKKTLFENRIMGTVRASLCDVLPPLDEFIKECYKPYSISTENTSIIHPTGKVANEIPWRYKVRETTKCTSFSGKLATYGGGGYTADLLADKNASMTLVNELKQNNWITRATRAVFFEFGVYNANLNLFAVVRLVFEFPATGGVIASPNFHTFRLFHYVTKFDYFLLGIEMLLICFIIFYTFEEMREISYFRKKIFSQFWFYMETLMLTIAYTALAFGAIRYHESSATIFRFGLNNKEYANCEELADISNTYDNLLAVLLILAYLKLFKYLSLNRSMSQLNMTLNRCYGDILAFSVMFFIMFCAYAEWGYLIFGSQSAGFATFGTAMFTLLRTILGDFDYMDIQNANATMAPIYFISYIFFVFFILLNMFLAIINDTYSDVKTEVHLRPDEMEMSDYIKKGWYRVLGKCGYKGATSEVDRESNVYNMTIRQIRIALKKCGFTDLEVEMFFARYNIDPTAEIGEFDINKLMADLEANIDRPKRDDTDTKQLGTDAKPVVPLHDFMAQQERLDELETGVGRLTNKVDALLKKLDALQQTKK